MSTIKPSLPKGTRDFNSAEVLRRRYIMEVIRGYFERYGFNPIETPTFENLSTLSGKYGEEGDTLLFKILNSGDWKKDLLPEELSAKSAAQLTPKVAEKGLRYDLTVPFARYVVMHQHEIQFPFKRYQLQPVFRADRPQKGRYREFWQCDADVVGSDALLYEWELIKIYDDVFAALGIPVVIKINNRKILQGLAEAAGVEDKFQDLTIAIDKLDKIMAEGVSRELENRGFTPEQIESCNGFLQIVGANEEKLGQADLLLQSSPSGKKGLEELRQVLFGLAPLNLKNTLEVDFTLARGLNYYTGAIFEVKAVGVQMGSIGGGGRYDDLTGMFGLKGLSGVGISFGLDRIYDVLEELQRFPEGAVGGTQVLCCPLDEPAVAFFLPLLQQMRAAGMAAELYPVPAKIAKQLKYADVRQIPLVLLAGEEERQTGQLTLKDIRTGVQEKLVVEELIRRLKP